MKRILFFIFGFSALISCTQQKHQQFTHEVLNRMTPIKDQANSHTCWIYAMLATIETEHLRWGDSVNLSPHYIEKMMENEPQKPKDNNGMGKTLINLIQKYGIVGYDAMRTTETPAPQYVFMFGAEYTPQEFARSVCSPYEYISLTSNSSEPYYKEIDINTPDNWLRDKFYNIPMDSLLAKTERAVREHHGVCWESAEHAMAIVGIAHDENGKKYFIMKNSWGTNRPHKGLEYVSFDEFRKETLAIELPSSAN